MTLRAAAATVLLATLDAIAPVAGAGDRAADAADAIELAAVAVTMMTIRQELAARCEAATGNAQFELCRDLDRSVGGWHAVGALRERIEDADGATPPEERERLQHDVRDRARFALSQLDLHIDELARRIVSGGSAPVSLLRDEIRLAREARVVVERLSLGAR